MDNLTHSLVGALIGQAGLKKKTGLAMPALIIGANIPDVDAACFFWLEGSEHLALRRGITHGPPALILLPALLAGLLWAFDRWQAKRGKRPEARLPVSFKWLYLLSFIGCLTHPALDWMNTYGIRLLEPFSHRWFYGDTLFIIDVWLWAIMGFATWFSLRREKRGGNWRKPAQIAIAVVLAYIGVNWFLSHVLYRTGFSDARPRYVIQSPVPLAFWRRETLVAFEDYYEDRVWVSDSSFGNHAMRPIASEFCAWPDLTEERTRNSSLNAFLFWSRAPYAERAEDGSVLIRDARFTNRAVSNGFTVPLPDVKCEEPEAGQPGLGS